MLGIMDKTTNKKQFPIECLLLISPQLFTNYYDLHFLYIFIIKSLSNWQQYLSGDKYYN